MVTIAKSLISVSSSQFVYDLHLRYSSELVDRAVPSQPPYACQSSVALDSLAPTRCRSPTAQGVYVTVHGHFYQPPRENPYLDAIERQPSAAPYHNWNERIHHECYRPNAFARVLNDRGEIVGIVNNYEYLSFNIGPTLMSWLERYDIEVYQRILEADRKSCERLNGHGNAIAQVYNHIILPLANDRDKLTQIRWGKADFRSRFGRDPEGMWLAETAVDYATAGGAGGRRGSSSSSWLRLRQSAVAQCPRLNILTLNGAKSVALKSIRPVPIAAS